MCVGGGCRCPMLAPQKNFFTYYTNTTTDKPTTPLTFIPKAVGSLGGTPPLVISPIRSTHLFCWFCFLPHKLVTPFFKLEAQWFLILCCENQKIFALGHEHSGSISYLPHSQKHTTNTAYFLPFPNYTNTLMRESSASYL